MYHTKKTKMTENDVFSLKSFIMAPYSYIHKTKASLPGTNIKLKVELQNMKIRTRDFIKNRSIQTEFIDNLDMNNEFDENQINNFFEIPKKLYFR